MRDRSLRYGPLKTGFFSHRKCHRIFVFFFCVACYFSFRDLAVKMGNAFVYLGGGGATATCLDLYFYFLRFFLKLHFCLVTEAKE